MASSCSSFSPAETFLVAGSSGLWHCDTFVVAVLHFQPILECTGVVLSGKVPASYEGQVGLEVELLGGSMTCMTNPREAVY